MTYENWRQKNWATVQEFICEGVIICGEAKRNGHEWMNSRTIAERVRAKNYSYKASEGQKYKVNNNFVKDMLLEFCGKYPQFKPMFRFRGEE